MVNMSLARIMYGTNDDVHAHYSTSLAAYSARSTTPVWDLSEKSAVSQPAGTAGILSKAWCALTGKG